MNRIEASSDFYNMMTSCLITEENINYMNNKKEKNDFNIKKLLGKDILTQSQSIKFGIIFEKVIKEILLYNNIEILNITHTSEVIKGSKQIDICFKHNDIIYYFEIKMNLNVDSEKLKITDDKVNYIKSYISNLYPTNEIICGILTVWYEKEKGMKIKPKTQIFYMKEIFDIIGLSNTEEQYYNSLLEFGKSLN